MSKVFIGIDTTAGRRPFTYAVLDHKLAVQECGEGHFDQIVDLVTAQPAALVAVDAPQSPNQGLMARPENRRQYGLPADSKGWRNCKVCEYEMRRHGIGLYLTPGDPERAPSWMQMGFRLYAALRATGYGMYQPGLAAERGLLEVHPHGCFTVLLGRRPLRKDTLEGRLQRQLVLYDEGLEVPNPMEAVEELTPHHLRAGTLTFPGLRTHDELDALVAAYTAYLAERHPEQITPIGDPEEGQIMLPVAPAEFKERYR
jgi:predicted RNase H-like nuclease